MFKLVDQKTGYPINTCRRTQMTKNVLKMIYISPSGARVTPPQDEEFVGSNHRTVPLFQQRDEVWGPA